MSKFILKSCVSLAAVATFGLTSAVALAQAAPADASDEAGLDEIVVTASGKDKTALKSSISVSSIDNEQITNFTPRSEAEVLRSIPGLNLQDTAGAGGNSNIGVRGIPVSTGGSEYVALQEDGLPVTLFGDIQFGNNDYWLRFDQNVARVEAVRGGSASTFASQAPGAVINYISKTGDKEGGAIDASIGVNYNEKRFDFDYGAHLSDSLRVHVGGFYKDGVGPTKIGFDAVHGYQIKANITKDLPDNRGFIRFSFKRLDDREPTNTAMPALASLSGDKITGYSTFAGLDPRRYSSAGIYNQNFLILNRAGGLETVKMEGIHPKVTSFGGELQYDFSDNFSVNNNFRITEMSGVFANQWTGGGELTSSYIGRQIGSVNNSADTRTIGSVVYAAGPRAGQVYTSTYINNNAQTYTRMNDVGSLANNLQVSGNFGDIKMRAGWFHMRQKIDMDWRINNNTQSLDTTSNSVPLNFYSGANGTGALLTANGLTGFNNQWGGCCGGRSYDTTFTDDAAYLNGNANFGGLDLDASVRFDSVKSSGISYSPVATGTLSVRDASGVSVSLPTFNTATSPTDRFNYRINYTSWSFGALYALNNDTSIFARVSRGGRFNADRLLYSGSYTAAGDINAGGRAKSVNFVSQQEIGIKNRGSLGSGRYNIEATLYRAQVAENNYDFTRNIAFNTTYRSYGLEVYGAVHVGGFDLDGSVIYTHSRDLGTGKVPATMPSLTYRISPTYDAGIFAIGASLNGQTSSRTRSGNYTVPGDYYVNGFVKVRPLDQLELGMNVNNLFNRLGYRGSADVGTIVGNTGLIDNSAVNGRTITASVKYNF